MNRSDQASRSARKLGGLLVKQGLVQPVDMDAILSDIQGLNADLPFILDKRGLVDELTVARTLSQTFQLPFVEVINPSSVLTDLNSISMSEMEKHRILPTGHNDSGAIPRIQVVLSNPFNLLHFRHLSTRTTFEVSIGASSVIKATFNSIVAAQNEVAFDSQILAQLLTSGIITTAHIDFAKQVLLTQRRNPSVMSGSKSDTLSKSDTHSP